MSDPTVQAEAVAAWRAFSRVVRGAVGPEVFAAVPADRRRLKRELETAELALVWLRSLADSCRDRLANEALPDVRS